MPSQAVGEKNVALAGSVGGRPDEVVGNAGRPVLNVDRAATNKPAALERSLHGKVVSMRVGAEIVVPPTEPGEHLGSRAVAGLKDGKSMHDPVRLVVEPGLALDDVIGRVWSGQRAHDGNRSCALIENKERLALKVLLGIDKPRVVAGPLCGVAVGVHELARRIGNRQRR